MGNILSFETPLLQKNFFNITETFEGWEIGFRTHQSAQICWEKFFIVKHFDHADRGSYQSEPIPVRDLAPAPEGLWALIKIPIRLYEIMSQGIVKVELIDADGTIIASKEVT